MAERRTVWQVLRADGWRWLLAGALIILPIYMWLFLYRLSTGDFNQDSSKIIGLDPLLATFALPLIFAVRAMGWKGWKWLIVLAAIAFITFLLPYGLAKQLQPGGYLTGFVVLLGITLVSKLLQPTLQPDSDIRYSRAAVALQSALLLVCIVLLLPAAWFL